MNGFIIEYSGFYINKKNWNVIWMILSYWNMKEFSSIPPSLFATLELIWLSFLGFMFWLSFTSSRCSGRYFLWKLCMFLHKYFIFGWEGWFARSVPANVSFLILSCFKAELGSLFMKERHSDRNKDRNKLRKLFIVRSLNQ